MRRRLRASDAILLAGSPRSGTTWLAGLLARDPGTCLSVEPLHPAPPRLADAGFGWRSFVPPTRPWPAGQAVMREIAAGCLVPLPTLVDSPLLQILRARRLLLKCVRANRLLPWIGAHCGMSAVIHLVRHPCAVVASQLADPRFPDSETPLDFDLECVDVLQPQLAGMVRRLRGALACRALTWALDQYVPLSLPPRGQTVAYESLVVGGAAAVDQLASAVGLQPGPLTDVDLARPSREAGQWATRPEAPLEQRLGRWREILSAGQVETIMEIVDWFGVTGYDREATPSGEVGLSGAAGGGRRGSGVA